MFEHNKDNLQKALGQLKSYDPPKGLWDSIADGLGQEEDTEEVLQEAVGKLPGYIPPVGVWNRLTKKLDEDDSRRKLRVVRRRQILGWAAVGALLLTTAAWLYHEPAPKVHMQYAQETVQEFRLNVDWNADESTFAQLEDMLAGVNDPAINKLRLEYEELSTAHQDVEAMLVSYGQDPQLIRQMADIERERTDIYRQIIEQI